MLIVMITWCVSDSVQILYSILCSFQNITDMYNILWITVWYDQNLHTFKKDPCEYYDKKKIRCTAGNSGGLKSDTLDFVISRQVLSDERKK